MAGNMKINQHGLNGVGGGLGVEMMRNRSTALSVYIQENATGHCTMTPRTTVQNTHVCCTCAVLFFGGGGGGHGWFLAQFG